MSDLVLRPRDGLFVKDGRGWYTSGAGRAYSYDWPPPSTLLGALRTAHGRTQENGVALSRVDWLRIAGEVSLGYSVALRLPVVPVGATPDLSHRLWPAPADALYLEQRDKLEQRGPGEKAPDSLASSAFNPPAEPVDDLLRGAIHHPQRDKVHRLDPVPDAAVHTLGCDPDDPAREALWRPVLDDQSKPEPAPKWWTEEDFVKWLLAGGPAPAGPSTAGATKEDSGEVDKLPKQDWPDPPRRVDVHVAIEAGTQAAKEGALFSHDVVETLSWREPRHPYEWALACRVGLPDNGNLNGQLLTLGGKRRLCQAEAAPATLFDWPAGLLKALDRAVGLRLVVVTPAEFKGGWLPDGLARVGDEYRGELDGWPGGPEVKLKAAFVGRPLHVSGWDMADLANKGKPGPKPTRRLVAPGAVYFIVPAEGGAFTEEQVQSLWLAGLGQNTAEGFGRVVPGVWTPAKKEAQGG